MSLNECARKILVVDDERGIRDGLRASLEQRGYRVETAESGEQALYRFKQSPDISFILSDYRMPGLNGFEIMKEIKKNSPQTKFVVMTGYGSVHHAVEAMQQGADDYLCKPFSIGDLEKVIEKQSPPSIQKESATILTQDSNFRGLLRKAERAAQSTAPILIEGASGTGKELLARQVHDWSARSKGPWVAINCAALPAGLLESELFGFEKGAFTGAMEKKSGKFEQADGGTLLLDEIGELDPILQAKLLRVLQEGELDRLGGKKPLKIDVRVIATTNRNLEQLVREGKFREDLFFRLYGVRLVLPSLRERRPDIALLAQFFLDRQATVSGRSLKFGPGVVEALERFPWPGNIRQLERSVERAAILSETGTLSVEHFDLDDRSSPAGPVWGSFAPTASKKSIREMEMEIILKALEAHQGNRTHTARALGMSLRTLRHKLKQYREAGFLRDVSRQFSLGKDGLDASVDAPLEPSEDGFRTGQYFA